MADGYTPDPADVELVATATERHHIDFDQSDADGNNPCVCGQWWDSAHMPGWDEHMAEVALSALAAAGRLNDGQAEARGYARAPVVPPVTPDPDLPATPDAALSADGRAALTQDLQRMARDRRLAADADQIRHRLLTEHREDTP